MPMIGSYMDETFDKPIDKQPKGTFVVGGLLGRGIALFELERRWEQLRKRPDIDIKYFKASDCQAGEKEFAKFERAKLDSISHDFLNLIAHPVPMDGRSYIAVHGVGVLQEDFYDIIKEPRARDILGPSPYFLAHDLAMIQCAWAMQELGDSYAVSFVCDEDGEHSHFADERYGSLKEANSIAAKYMGSFASRDDKKCETLQAADAAAFEVRRALNLSLKMWEGELRKQFNILSQAHSMFLITHTTRDQLLHIVKTHKPGEPFKLDPLMEMRRDEDIRIIL